MKTKLIINSIIMRIVIIKKPHSFHYAASQFIIVNYLELLHAVACKWNNPDFLIAPNPPCTSIKF